MAATAENDIGVMFADPVGDSRLRQIAAIAERHDLQPGWNFGRQGAAGIADRERDATSGGQPAARKAQLRTLDAATGQVLRVGEDVGRGHGSLRLLPYCCPRRQ